MSTAAEIILEYICPSLGMIVAWLMWLAPVKDLRDAVRRGAGLGDLNPTPWAMMLGNCVGWSSYGLLASNWFVFLANYPGFLISCWLNLGAVKLLYASHHTDETRRSLVDYLSSAPLDAANLDRFKEKDPNKSENRDQDQIETAVDVENGDRIASGAPHPSLRSTEDPQDDNTNPADTPPSIQLRHKTHTDWTKIIWDVTSQTTPAPAPHDRLVLGMVIAWSLVLSGVGFFGRSSGDSTNGVGQMVVGYIVNLNLVFFYGAPLSAIGKVLRSRLSDALHVPTMIMNTSGATFWTAYAIAVNDPFIYVPNGLGVVLGAIQFVLWIIFPKSTTSSGAIATKPSEHGSIPEQRDSSNSPNPTIESTVSIASA